MSSFHCSLSATTDPMKRRQSRFALICALLRQLFFSSSQAKVSSGVRSACYTIEATEEDKPKLEEAGEDEAAQVKDERGEKNLEEMVGEVRGEKGGAGDAAATASSTLQTAVKQLHFGGWEEKEAAAAAIRRIALKDGRARKSLAALGVIPSLVCMLDSDNDRRRRLAVQALIGLANGSFTNKALMVEAGVLKRLPRLIMDTREPPRRKECLVLLFSISSLAKTQFHVAAGDVVPPLVEILNNDSTVDELKLACLGTLYNLSTKLDNIREITSAGAVRTLVRLSREKAGSEVALASLGNLVVTAMGRTAMEEDEMVPGALFEIMTWDDKPRSQELVVYVLMVLAHGSAVQRRKMTNSGLVPLLLEVALLGTPLARKRALKTLQWFKTDTQTNMAGHPWLQAKKCDMSMDTMVGQRETKEYRTNVKRMVRQSLHKNMEDITRRATVPEDASRTTRLVLIHSAVARPQPY